MLPFVQDFGQVKVIITKTSKFKPDLNYTLETFITHSLGGSNQGKMPDILLDILFVHLSITR